MKRILLSVLVAVVLAGGYWYGAQPSPAAKAALPARVVVSGSFLLGRSELGRPIVAVRAGDPQAPRVLVVGCIQGLSKKPPFAVRPGS